MAAVNRMQADDTKKMFILANIVVCPDQALVKNNLAAALQVSNLANC